MAVMVANNYHFSYTNYEEMTEEGQQTGYVLTGPKKVGLLQDPDYLVRRNDYALWLKVLHHATAYLLDSVQASHRLRTTDSLTNRVVGSHTLLKYDVALYL